MTDRVSCDTPAAPRQAIRTGFVVRVGGLQHGAADHVRLDGDIAARRAQRWRQRAAVTSVHAPQRGGGVCVEHLQERGGVGPNNRVVVG
jgi:hypothetical protein